MAKIRNEYIEAAERLDLAYKQCSGNACFARMLDLFSTNSKAFVGKVEFVRSGVDAKIAKHSQAIDIGLLDESQIVNAAKALSPTGTNHVYIRCYNQTYAFALTKPAGKDEFRVEFVDQNVAKFSESIAYTIEQGVCLPTHVGPFRLAELIKFPNFTITHVTNQLLATNEPAKLIEFTITPLVPQKSSITRSHPKNLGRGRLKGGWLLVAPNQSWALHAYELHIEREGMGIEKLEIGKFQYAPQSSDLPIPTYAWVATGIRKADGSVRYKTVNTLDYNEFRFGPTNKNEFTSEHYGLPGLSHAHRITYANGQRAMLLFALGTVTIVISFGCRRLQTQQREIKTK